MLPLLPPKSIPRVTQSNSDIEWLEAIRAGQPHHAGGNFEYSARLTEFVLLGNLAILSGQKILWDSAKMRVTNLPAANQFVKPSFRKGWEPESIV